MLEETKIISKEQLPILVADVLKAVCTNEATERAVVIALNGDLGAGKTTFVQELAQTLGVTEHVTSPTFTIMKGYETKDTLFQNLIHMDAYRIDDESELRPLRFADILATPHTLFCIEWAEKIASALPPNVLTISISAVSENTRSVHISQA